MAITEADRAYVEAGYATLEMLCAGRPGTVAAVRDLIEARRLPRGSYVLDGTGMFPADYFELVDDAGGAGRLRTHFAARHRRAATAEGVGVSTLERDWEAYLDGAYGVCLRRVTPETIVRKSALVSSLCQLLVLARPGDPTWRDALRDQVDELDALERQFAPDCDRAGPFGRLPTRDLLVDAARERFPAVFAGPTAPDRPQPA